MNKKRASKDQYYKQNGYLLVNFDEKKDAKSYFSYNPTTKIATAVYYARTPSPVNKVVTIPKIIQDNVILQEFLRTDANTGEVQIVPFNELPSGMPRYNIIKYCNTQNAVKRKIKGGYWAFV